MRKPESGSAVGSDDSPRIMELTRFVLLRGVETSRKATPADRSEGTKDANEL
mgnify:CR=1 FL=1